MSVFSSDSRIVVIGGGKMGEAIVGGLIASTVAPADALSASNFTVAEPGEARRAYLVDTYGVSCVEDASTVEDVDVVLLAVKPQVMMGVLATLQDKPAFGGAAEGPLYISIAAGLSTERLEAALPQGVRLVRTMPNTPLMVGKGAVAVCPGAAASVAEAEQVRDLFSCLGEAVIVPEEQIDVVCAISGSGPAYVARMIEVLTEAGAAEGLDAALAEKLALQTVLGTASLIAETGQSPTDTRISVCSPGGTTLAALEAMEKAGFEKSLEDGVRAAVIRGKELGKL